jgi:hypothetical protein
MRTVQKASRATVLAGLTLTLAVGTVCWAQATSGGPSSDTPSATPTAQPGPDTKPGSAPVGTDAPTPAAPPASADSKDQKPAATNSQDDKTSAPKSKDGKPAPGTAPVGGDTAVNPDKVVEPGSQKVNVKPGSIDDVSAVGNRDIGGRGMGNWYSTDTEIKMGKSYAMDVEKSSKLIKDPVVTEYVNRIGQNIVKNSDCKVPFTIEVIDSDEINAFALPGGFFFVNSGLWLTKQLTCVRIISPAR